MAAAEKNPFDIGLTAALPPGHEYAGGYTLRLSHVSGVDDQDIYKETGRTVFAHFASLSQETGMGAIVASVVIWLVRRREEPTLSYREVARSITWGTDFKLRDADDTGEAGKASESAASPESTDSSETSPTSTPSVPGNSTT